MDMVIKDMGIKAIAMTKANISLATSPAYTGGSSYTRCAWEVKLGNVDLCVGDFWETSVRRDLVSFTTALDQDTMFLVTRAVKPEPFKTENILAIFKPFEASVWLIILCMFIFGALALWFVEAPYNTDELEGFRPGQGPPNIEGLVQALTITTTGFVNLQLPASTWPARMVALGYGFFVFIAGSSYTASLASYMVSTSAQLGDVSTLTDVVMLDKKLCVLDTLPPGLITNQGVSRVPMDNYGAMLEKLYLGGCIAAVVGKMELLTYIRASTRNVTVCADPLDPLGQTACVDRSVPSKVIRLNPSTCGDDCTGARRYCEIIDTKDSDFEVSIATALPVRKSLEPALSAAILARKLSGDLSRAQQAEIYDPNPNLCPLPEEPAQGMSLKNLAGTYLIGGGIMLVGVLMRAGNLLTRTLRSSRHASGDAAEDSAPAEDAGNGEGAAGMNRGGGGKAAAAANGDTQAVSPFSKSLLALDELQRRLERLAHTPSGLGAVSAPTASEPSPSPTAPTPPPASLPGQEERRRGSRSSEASEPSVNV